MSLVTWSPDGAKLFAATPGRTFRVWSCQDWSPERWSVGGAKGRVSAAAWSPSGDHVVFSVTDETVLYAMSFTAGAGDAAIPVVDLSQLAVHDGQEEIIAGGLVQSLAWDATGQRIAVSFSSTPLVALLAARPGTSLSISPVGWVRGGVAEWPACLQFQPSETVGGAVLTVGWSSGRIQHLPLVFIPGSLEAAGGEEQRPHLFSQSP